MAGDEDNAKETMARLEKDVRAYTERFTEFEGALDTRLKSIETSNETFTQTLAAIMERLDAHDVRLATTATATVAPRLPATNTGLPRARRVPPGYPSHPLTHTAAVNQSRPRNANSIVAPHADIQDDNYYGDFEDPDAVNYNNDRDHRRLCNN